MNADEVEGWDDWTRPARFWPLVFLTLAPPVGIAVIAWIVSRAVGA